MSEYVMRKRSERASAVQDRYRAAVLDSWLGSVPSEYKGFEAADISDGLWNEHIRRGDARALERYIDAPERFLVLKGTEGLGKTTLAVTVATAVLVEHGIVPRMRSVPILLDDFSFSREERPMQECIGAGLLILDDIGAGNEGITPHQKRNLWGVVDQRWAMHRPTIITTNMPVTSSAEGQGLRDWFGASMWARIADGITLVEMRGDSMRSAVERRAAV